MGWGCLALLVGVWAVKMLALRLAHMVNCLIFCDLFDLFPLHLSQKYISKVKGSAKKKHRKNKKTLKIKKINNSEIDHKNP